MGACKKLNISADELNTLWGKAKKAGNLVKFGGGFYCGLINDVRPIPRPAQPCFQRQHFQTQWQLQCVGLAD